MSIEIIPAILPEERELSEKAARLLVLDQQLADAELELATLQGQVNAFEARYFKVVGYRLVQIDELELQIAQARLQLDPGNELLLARVSEAAANQTESAAMAEAASKKPTFLPSPDLKALYRKVALMVHSDLTTDLDQKSLRDKVFSDANQAYQDGDATRLLAVLNDWQESPESVVGEDLAHKLVRAIRRMNQVERSLLEINQGITQLHESEAFLLKVRVELQMENGIDLLEVTAQQAEAKLVELRASKAALELRGGRA